ncbi:hypothetical protein, partial [Novosphingobium sp. B-7]
MLPVMVKGASVPAAAGDIDGGNNLSGDLSGAPHAAGKGPAWRRDAAWVAAAALAGAALLWL